MRNPLNDPNATVPAVRDAMLEKHLPFIEEAGKKGVQILCLQEIFNGPYFCPSQDAQLVRHRRGRARPDGRAPVGVREEVQDGDGRPGLRAGDGRRLLQHRRRHRRRRDVPRQVPQEPHPADQRLLGEVLLQARQPRLPDLPDPVREDRRLHLLRPPLPRGRAPARPARRGDRVQPLGHGRGPLAVPVEARAARARGRQRLLRRGLEPRRAPRRRGTSASSTARATSATRAATSSRRAARTRTSSSSPR